MIYLDSAATTSVSPAVVNAMMPYLTNEYGNPGSLHSLGRRALDGVNWARERVAEFLHTTPEHIIFTSGGSEANNLAILGWNSAFEEEAFPRAVYSAIEHSSTLRAFESGEHDFYTYIFPVRHDGVIDIEDLQAYCESKKTRFLSAMYVNNEIGSVNDVESIGAICRERGILFHTDCVQAAGVFDLDVEEIGCDFLSISAHKIHGPKGVGALYARYPGCLLPLIHGGSEQEFGVRGGTENVAGIVGFGAACFETMASMHDVMEYISDLKYGFYKKLCERSGYAVWFNGPGPTSKGKILSLTFPGVDAETLILMLDQRGICVSAGSACSSHEVHPSHVLKAIGLSDEDARSTIRLSFSRENTWEEIEEASVVIAECVNQLRTLGV